jgi:protein-tyrosine phosphatase
MPRPYRILFVCLGNICRSPAAEIIFRQQATDSGRAEDFEIDSAGTIGHHAGSPPDSRMSDFRRLEAGGKAHAEIRPFVSFCRHHDDLRVPDPYYGGQRGFDHVIELLKDGCEGILQSLPTR